jgi:2-acylglycerol O-acyltransferase 2
MEDATHVPIVPTIMMNNRNKIDSDPLSTQTFLLRVLAFTWMIGLAVTVNVALLLGSFWYPRSIGTLVILYYSYILFYSKPEQALGKPWRKFSQNHIIFRWARQYLNLRIEMAPELRQHGNNPDTTDDNQTQTTRFLFAVFPHGCNSDYRLLMDGMLSSGSGGGDERQRWRLNVRTLAATILFRIPWIREICLWTGCVDARKQTAEQIFQQQQTTTNNKNNLISLMVLPGGQMEQLLTQRGREIIYLKKRKGFIRLAMQYQVPIVPVYVFGCSDYYATSSWAQSFRIRWLLKYTGMAIPLCWGIHFFCPSPIPTTVVFGKPIFIPTKETTTTTTIPSISNRHTPTTTSSSTPQGEDRSANTTTISTPMQLHPDQVDAVHAEFMTALQQLFDQHKHRLGYSDRQLEIY